MDHQRASKIKFNRQYYEYNPSVYSGPSAEILDTIVTPIRESDDDVIRDIKNSIQ